MASRKIHGLRDQPRRRDAGVGDAFFAARQVVGDEGTIGPRNHVAVERVHLAERRAHLSDLDEQPAWNRGEREEALLEIDALLPERHEEVGAGVGIDDRLEGGLRLGHLQRGTRIDRVPAGRAEEVPDHGDVGVEDLRGRRRCAVDRQRPRRTAGASGAGRHFDRCLLGRVLRLLHRRCGRRAVPRRASSALSRSPYCCLDLGQLLPELLDLLSQRLWVAPSAPTPTAARDRAGRRSARRTLIHVPVHASVLSDELKVSKAGDSPAVITD